MATTITERTERRRGLVPYPDLYESFDAPRFCMTHVALVGLLKSVERINSAKRDLKGFSDYSDAVNEMIEVIVKAHWMVGVALDEYAVNYFHEFGQHNGMTKEELDTVLKPSVTSGSAEKPFPKIKVFSEVCKRKDILNSPGLADLKHLCEVRDTLYHYEAHRYAGGTSKTFAEAIEAFAIETKDDEAKIGPLGFILSSNFANRAVMAPVRLIDTLLKKWKCYSTQSSIQDMVANKCAMLLVQPFGAMPLDKALTIALRRMRLERAELKRVQFKRTDDGVFFFLKTKNAERAAFVSWETGTARAVRPTDESAINSKSNRCYGLLPLSTEDESFDPEAMSVLMQGGVTRPRA